MDLVREVASRTLLPPETVRLVIDNMVVVGRETIGRGWCFILRNFGVFEARKFTKGFGGVSFRFKPSAELKKAAQETFRPTMEKYGVETKNEAALLAQVTGECPVCKSKLETTNPPKCPNCGTEPFENKEQK